MTLPFCRKSLLPLACCWLLVTGGCGGREPEAAAFIVAAPPPPAATEALAAVSQPVDLPARDPLALQAAFTGATAAAAVLPQTNPPQQGDRASFWVKNLAANSNEQIEARLLARTDALSMWVQLGQRVPQAKLAAAARVIGEQILPLNRDVFGQEWSPGIDGDPRIHLLHLATLNGPGIAYFSSADEFVTAVNPYSNQREMLYVSLAASPLGSSQYYATIAHELQHLSQWHQDRNEAAWVSEGLSELAAHLNGYPTGRESQYVASTDVQLTTLDPAALDDHYAAAFLFMAYFHDRFGVGATRALAARPENGAAGFAGVLADRNLGGGLTFEDLFADWLVANYLQGAGSDQPPYRYQSVTLPALPTTTVQLNGTPQATTVHQYGADFYALQGRAPVTFIFTGTQQVATTGTAAHSGQHFWISYPADESALHLTRRFDLSGLDSATLTFWTWYDIEAGWDYGYLAVSGDDGRSWQLLATGGTTRENPVGNSFGPGYTGRSGGGAAPAWVQETADLTPYVGQEVLVRFYLVTDDAILGDGLAIDDVAIPELGYRDDMENGAGAWEAAGFVRATAVLPQQFLVQLILPGAGGAAVGRLPLDDSGQGRWQIPLSPGTPRAVLSVSGVTPFTRRPAAYAYAAKPAP